jgi:hypothetical protein
MKMQEARFQALVAAYQETVLRANAEVEDGLAALLGAQERTMLLDHGVAELRQAADLISKEYRSGAADFQYVAMIEQNLVLQQDLQAQAQGDIAQGLIQVYRALGGGWQVPPDGAVAVQANPHATPPPLEHPQTAPPQIPEPALPAPPTLSKAESLAPPPLERKATSLEMAANPELRR